MVNIDLTQLALVAYNRGEAAHITLEYIASLRRVAKTMKRIEKTLIEVITLSEALANSNASVDRLMNLPLDIRWECDIPTVRKAFQALGLIVSVEIFDRFIKAQNDMQNGRIDSRVSLPRFKEACNHLIITVRTELATKIVLSLDTSKESLYKNPEDGWEDVIKAWPNSVYDVREASYCLSLERSTAVVFHLSRIAERGLRDACLKYIPASGIPQPPRTMMGNYIDAIDKFANVRPPKPAGSKELLEASAHFSRIKNVWRDDVSHTGAKYTDGEAQMCYDAVRGMLTVCAKILNP